MFCMLPVGLWSVLSCMLPEQRCLYNTAFVAPECVGDRFLAVVCVCFRSHAWSRFLGHSLYPLSSAAWRSSANTIDQ